MKIIVLKKIQAYVLYSSLKRTAPKEFTDVEEMTTVVNGIFPVLAQSCEKFVKYRQEAESLGNAITVGDLTEAEYKEKFVSLQKDVRKYELREGEEEIEIEMENADHGVLLKLFERFGKTWFDKVEDFIAVQQVLKSAIDKVAKKMVKGEDGD